MMEELLERTALIRQRLDEEAGVDEYRPTPRARPKADQQKHQPTAMSPAETEVRRGLCNTAKM